MVPRRPGSGFVGREAELAAIEAALAASGRSALTQPASVHGLGGVGKTLPAVEFASRHADHLNTVPRVPAEQPIALALSFAQRARGLGLPEAVETCQGVWPLWGPTANIVGFGNIEKPRDDIAFIRSSDKTRTAAHLPGFPRGFVRAY
jgi:hypothetical protein